jgi:hypothetical protein
MGRMDRQVSRVSGEIRAFIAEHIRRGFESPHVIIEGACHLAQESGLGNDSQPEIRRFTAELLAEHGSKQAGWDETTDCDRLNQAFAVLNR